MSDPTFHAVTVIGRREQAVELDVPAIGRRLTMEPRQVHDLCRRTGAPFYKIGREWRVSAQDLEQWIKEQKGARRKATRPNRTTRRVIIKTKEAP